MTAKAIAEAIGRGLKIPVVSLSPDEVAAHFGWMGMFAAMDMPASSASLKSGSDGTRPRRPG